MHRDKLLKLLERYGQRFPDERAMLQRMQDFVTSNEACFDRALTTGHITGSAWVLDASAQKTLLTHHAKLDIWVQPGGHADGDADVARVAMREALEETGLGSLELAVNELFDIDIHAIPERGSEPRHYHYDCRFLIRCTGDEGYTVTEESHDLAWIPLSRIADYTSEASILRMVEKTVGFVASTAAGSTPA